MLEFNHPPPRESKEDMRKRIETEKHVLDFMLDMLLSSDIPDHEKIELLILRSVKKLREKMNAFLEIATPQCDEDKKKELYPIRKEVLEYVQLMNIGVDTFLAEHPLPSITTKE